MIDPTMAAAAQRALHQLKARDAAFGEDADGFGDPAWTILLALAAAGGALPVSTLSALGGATVVGLRYLEWLAKRGLVSRDDDDAHLDDVAAAKLRIALGLGSDPPPAGKPT